MSRALAPFEGKRLKIARNMRLVPELVRELENFKVKVNLTTAHDSYEAWRESGWWAERRPALRVTRRPACNELSG